MLIPALSNESLLRFFFYVGGVASTVIGSFVSSKIRVYHDNRKAHLEDIQAKVLTPIRDGFEEHYRNLVTHQAFAVKPVWGVRRQKGEVRVTDNPNEYGTVLVKNSPDVCGFADQALYLDAKKKHFKKVMVRAEQFVAAWDAHAADCHRWILRISSDILANSNLPEIPASPSSGSVRPYHLALFIYRRLFGRTEFALIKRNQALGSQWSLEGFEGTTACATEKELDDILFLVEEIIAKERPTAANLQKNAQALERELSSVISNLSYSVASRRLHGRCDFVTFF